MSYPTTGSFPIHQELLSVVRDNSALLGMFPPRWRWLADPWLRSVDPVLSSPSPLITLSTLDVLSLRSVGPPTVPRRESPAPRRIQSFAFRGSSVDECMPATGAAGGNLNYEFSTAATMISMQSVQILLNMVKKLLKVSRRPLSVVLQKTFNVICKLAIIVSGLALQ